MRIIGETTLDRYAERYPKARAGLITWRAMAKAAQWTDREHVSRTATSVDHFLKGPRIVFKIDNGSFRLIVGVLYAVPVTPERRGRQGIFYVKFFGTHAEYDRIDAASVEP